MINKLQVQSSTLTLAALSGAMLTASLGNSIATVALPTLTREFSISVSEVKWVVLAYLISTTVAIVSAGRLGDIFGRRLILIAGLSLFITSSVFCAVVPSFDQLIAGRVLQGLGGAILMALPVALARDAVAQDRLGSAMGLMGTMSAIGTALGPSVGGALIAAAGWRAIFLLLAAVGCLALLLAVTTIPVGSRSAKASLRQMDFPGTVLLVALLVVYALLTGGGTVGTAWGASLLLPGLLVATILFVIVETRSSSPLVPMHLLRSRRTGTAFAMNIFVGTVMMSTLVVGPFFLTFVLNLNEAAVGLVMAVGPMVAALSGLPAGRITDRYGAGRIVFAGLIQAMIGLICLALLPRVLGVGGYVIAMMLLTPGFQLFLAANNTAVMADAPEEQRGRLSGLLGLSRNLGFMTGASAMSTLFATILGSETIALESSTKIAMAFSSTFVIAAGLAATAILLAFLGRDAGTHGRDRH